MNATGVASRLSALSLWAAIAIASCSDQINGPGAPARPSFVSDPVTVPSMQSSTSLQSVVGPNSTIYVSLPSGTFETGSRVVIRHAASGFDLTAPIVDGGFDPLPIPAAVGDKLELDVVDDNGATLQSLNATVPASQAPRVVRTIPPRRKTAVPINARIVIVFSEPMGKVTLAPASIQLFQGNTAVAGTARFVEASQDASHLTVQFVPSVPLSASTSYRLVVGTNVRDVGGDAMVSPADVSFTTGTSVVGPPSSIQLSPDSLLELITGATYQMAAMVRDADGNVLPDELVSWSTNNPNSLGISPTGMLTALGDGSFQVKATVGALTKMMTVYVSARPAASISIAPAPAAVSAGETILLGATVRDADGHVINRPLVKWSSSATAVATIYTPNVDTVGVVLGKVTGISEGAATITATSGTVTGSTAITVEPPQPVASLTLTPGSTTIIVQGSAWLTATLRDASDRILSARPITWTSSNSAVATVTDGLVMGISQGSAAVIATREGVSDTAAVTVTTLSFASVVAGYAHTCGVTTDGVAYCWGANLSGQLGNALPPIELYPGDPDYWDELYYGSFVPVPVSGGLTFSLVSAGGHHTCGLTAAGAAYCWGWARAGRLGVESSTAASTCVPDSLWLGMCSNTPMMVGGALTLSTLSAGVGSGSPEFGHTCGLISNGRAYCWGENGYGQLGGGSSDLSDHAVPAPAAGALTFVALHLGTTHTCGLTSTGTTHCWGYNVLGQLGNGSTAASLTPVSVAGGHAFVALNGGAWHTCGLTAAGAAYCWGSNYYGQLGHGASAPQDPLKDFSAVPVAVTGGLTFAALTGGGFHTCALTSAGSAHCWGMNRFGALGIGDNAGPDRCLRGILGEQSCGRTPLAVAGGLSFTSLSAGGMHTCGLTTNRVAYCWGPAGPIGDGSSTLVGNSGVPVKVAGQP